MNNLTIGGAGFTYYETLGGGQGAGPNADGPSAVHVAMSNTRNTPVEALETAYPDPGRAIRRCVGDRRGGGPPRRRRGHAGAARAGGRGGQRDLRTPAHAHRGGAASGADGRRARIGSTGTALPAKWRGRRRRRDLIEIETPGGGGWGPPRR